MDNQKTILLSVEHLRKIYNSRFGSNQVEALKNISFSVDQGEFIAVMGESGSGKTTLLNLLAALDRPTEGKILLAGKDITQIGDSNISRFRRENLGFVFQDFNLLDNFSLRDNIYLPLVLSNTPKKQMEKQIEPLAAQLKISDILEKYPYEVSGGQKQRAGYCPCIDYCSKLVLADEPTGALNKSNSEDVLDLLSRLNQSGQSILMVTHDVRAALRGNRILYLEDGKVLDELNLPVYDAGQLKERETQVNGWLSALQW